MRKDRLESEAIRKVDKSGMLDLLLDFPGQFKSALNIAQGSGVSLDKKKISKIAFVGVGGSAIGADVVRSYLYSESRLPVNVYRDYCLPACVDDSTLVFLLSYSGNTEEVLNSYAQAEEKGSRIIAISSGGKLKERARKDRVAFISIPEGIPPRCAIGYLSIVPLCLLAKAGIIKDIRGAVTDTVRVLEELRDKGLNPSLSLKDNIAKSAAYRLFNRFAVVYSGSLHFDVCVTRFRAQLSENAKVLASGHLFPEANHSEIEGWRNPKGLFKNFAVAMFRDKEMHRNVARGIDISEGILKKQGVKVIEIWSHGQALLSRIFSLIYTGDFISYYLAILYGVDPVPIERIVYLKGRLAHNRTNPLK